METFIAVKCLHANFSSSAEPAAPAAAAAAAAAFLFSLPLLSQEREREKVTISHLSWKNGRRTPSRL